MDAITQMVIEAVQRFLHHLFTDPNKAMEDVGMFLFRFIMLVGLLWTLLQLKFGKGK